MGRTSPNVTATSLPNITALRDELGYGNPQLTHCSAFHDDVRGFRRKFVTSTGLAGPDLHIWKLREHQAGLEEMTAAYLDREQNGPLYWPDAESSVHYNNLRYSKDRPRIKRLMKQLFFRLNQQQYRNQKYKTKDKEASIDVPPKGLSALDPIELDSQPCSPTEDQRNTSGPAHHPVHGAVVTDRAAQTAHNNEQRVKVEDPELDQIYSFQGTPAPLDPNRNQGNGPHIRKDIPVQTQPRKRKPEVRTPDHAAKRSKPRTKPQDKGQPNANASLSNAGQSLSTPTRRSGRQRNLPDYRDSRDTDHSDVEVPTAEAPSMPGLAAGLENGPSRATSSVATSLAAGVRATATLQPPDALDPAHTYSESIFVPPRTFASFRDEPSSTASGQLSQAAPAPQSRRSEDPKAPKIQLGSTGLIAAESSPASMVAAAIASTRSASSPSHAAPRSLAQPTTTTDTTPDLAALAIARPVIPSDSSQPKEQMERQQQPDMSAPLPPASPAQPKIRFIYRIILSRQPVYSYRTWIPAQRLEDTSLSQIIQEANATTTASIKGVLFVVEGPGFRATEEIPCDGGETHFASFVKQIKKVIRGLLLSGQGVDSPLVFEMYIEPNGKKGDSKVDEEDFGDLHI